MCIRDRFWAGLDDCQLLFNGSGQFPGLVRSIGSFGSPQNLAVAIDEQNLNVIFVR